MQIIHLSDTIHKTISRLDPEYSYHSEMTPSEQAFLTALIQKYKPKKVLEIGVAAGSSAVLLLNALSDLPEKKLISVDYAAQYYRDKSKKSGFVVDHYPELKKNWTLYVGGLVSEHIDKIGGEIDFCFIDTMHIIPGEIIDFLAILPYLSKNAVIVFHDTNLHTWESFSSCNVNNLLISAISGEKLVQESYEDVFYHTTLKQDIHMPFSNIAAVILDENQKDRVWDIFNLLTQQWSYLLNEHDLDSFRRIIAQHYDAYYLEYFNTVVAYQQKLSNRNSSLSYSAAEPLAPMTKSEKKKLIWRYRKYKFLSKITFGYRRQKYIQKRNMIKSILKAAKNR